MDNNLSEKIIAFFEKVYCGSSKNSNIDSLCLDSGLDISIADFYADLKFKMQKGEDFYKGTLDSGYLGGIKVADKKEVEYGEYSCKNKNVDSEFKKYDIPMWIGDINNVQNKKVLVYGLEARDSKSKLDFYQNKNKTGVFGMMFGSERWGYKLSGGEAKGYAGHNVYYGATIPLIKDNTTVIYSDVIKEYKVICNNENDKKARNFFALFTNYLKKDKTIKKEKLLNEFKIHNKILKEEIKIINPDIIIFFGKDSVDVARSLKDYSHIDLSSSGKLFTHLLENKNEKINVSLINYINNNTANNLPKLKPLIFTVPHPANGGVIFTNPITKYISDEYLK